MTEVDKRLAPAAMFSEVAVFSPEAKRAATAVRRDTCEIYLIAGKKMLELLYLDRRFAFQNARSLPSYAVG